VGIAVLRPSAVADPARNQLQPGPHHNGRRPSPPRALVSKGVEYQPRANVAAQARAEYPGPRADVHADGRRGSDPSPRHGAAIRDQFSRQAHNESPGQGYRREAHERQSDSPNRGYRHPKEHDRQSDSPSRSGYNRRDGHERQSDSPNRGYRRPNEHERQSDSPIRGGYNNRRQEHDTRNESPSRGGYRRPDDHERPIAVARSDVRGRDDSHKLVMPSSSDIILRPAMPPSDLQKPRKYYSLCDTTTSSSSSSSSSNS